MPLTMSITSSVAGGSRTTRRSAGPCRTGRRRARRSASSCRWSPSS
jgi:hypothetical protein